MIFTKGSILDSDAMALVNPVNTVGVMGLGLALEFKKRYPEMFRSYKIKCNNGQFPIGELQYVLNPDGKIIINFPTKKHWRDPSRLEYIESGLITFISFYSNLESVAFPKLGCGYGQLNWEEEVKPLMVNYLSNLPCEIVVYV